MSNSVNAAPNRVDVFFERPDVQRFQEVAGSILKSAGCVALVALVVFASLALLTLTIGSFTLGCMACSGALVPLVVVEGVQLIFGSIPLAIMTGAFIGVFGGGVVAMAMNQCEETHRLIWDN